MYPKYMTTQMKKALFVIALCAISPLSPAENGDLSSPFEKGSPLRPSDHVTGAVKLLDRKVLFGAVQQWAKSGNYRDRIWRRAFLANDGQFICWHHNSYYTAGGAA